MKTCPFCANEIQDAAIKCQYCHSMLGQVPTPLAATAATEPVASVAPVATAAPVRAPAPTRPKPHGFLRLLIFVGVAYFVGAAIYQGLQERWLSVVVNLVVTVPFALTAPVFWSLGDVFRRFAMPDWVVGHGAIDMAKQRLFWMVGPQSVGVLIVFGVFAAGGAVAGLVPGFDDLLPQSAGPASHPAPVAATPSPAPIAAAAPAAPAAAPAPAPSGAPFSASDQGDGDIANLPPAAAAEFETYRVAVYDGPPAASFEKLTDASAGPLAPQVPHIRSQLAKGPNFAGQFVVIALDCGARCFAAMAVDVATGEATELPYHGKDYPDLQVAFVRDSKLLKVRWSAGADASGGGTCEREDFVLEAGAFRSLSRSDTPGPC